MNEIVGGAVLALATGLTTLAYAKPREFRRIGLPLSALAIIYGLGTVGWSFAVDIIGNQMLPYVVPNRAAAAHKAMDELRPSLWLSACAALASAYNTVLIWLPEILGKKND